MFVSEFGADIGRRITDLMQRRGLTQKQVAEAVGTNRSLVSLWQSGQRIPTTRAVAKLAPALGATTDYLLGVDGHSAPTGVALVDLAEAVHDDLWTWRGRRVTPETRRRARGVLHFLLAPSDQLQIPSVRQGETTRNANTTRARLQPIDNPIPPELRPSAERGRRRGRGRGTVGGGGA